MTKQLTSKIPVDLKYRNGVSKYILRKILYKYTPKELVDGPKMGFGVPVYEWFKSDLKPLYFQNLFEKRIKEHGIFNPEEVDKLLKAYLEDSGIDYNKLWLLFVFELWRERWKPNL